MLPVNSGHRCHLPGGEIYESIGFDDWNLHLTVSNFRGTPCDLCKEMISPGEGVERKGKRGSQFICMDCVKKIIVGYELGFMLTRLNNLQACTMHHGRYTGQVVFDGIKRISEARVVKFEVTFIGERKRKSKGVGDGAKPEPSDKPVHPGPGE